MKSTISKISILSEICRENAILNFQDRCDYTELKTYYNTPDQATTRRVLTVKLCGVNFALKTCGLELAAKLDGWTDYPQEIRELGVAS